MRSAALCHYAVAANAILCAATLPAFATPTITITSPNGGEVWASGSSHDIQWTAMNPTGNVYIDLYQGGVFKQRLGTVSMGLQSFWWQSLCTASADASNYRIRITWTADANVFDRSDSTFAITAPNPPPSLSLTYPNGGETLTPGPVHITWATQNLPGFLQVYLDDANTSRLIGNPLIASGQFTWNICAATPLGSDFRIRLRSEQSLCDTFLTDESDAPFSITGTTPLTITQPAAGATIAASTYQRIFWDNGSNAIGNVNIYLVRPGFSQLLGQTSGWYGGFDGTWVCPSAGNASDYRIMLTGSSCAAGGIFTLSEPFTIDGAAQPQDITVLSPNGGESLIPGQPAPIIWTSNNLSSAAFVRLYLVNGAQQPLLLDAVPARSGSYPWIVPYCAAGGADYRIKLSATSCNSVNDFSDAPFTIANPLPPLRITSPNGGETLHGGTVRRITWDSSMSIGGVLVWLKKTGQDDRIIGVACIADGGIDWDICQNFGDGTDYRIKAAVITNCDVIYDESDADFAIESSPMQVPPPPPSLTVTAPHADDILQGGTTYPIQWTSTNPSGNVGIYELIWPAYPPYAWARFQPIAAVPMADGHFDWPLPACSPDNPVNWHQLVFFYGCGSDYAEADAGGYVQIQTATLSPGDVNGDCVVDLLDAALFAQVLLKQERSLPFALNADLNHDAIVDGRDVAGFVAALLP